MAILLSCEDPLERVEIVSDARVLGARAEVVGDPARAAPAPGESVNVTFLVASPELAPELGYALFACLAAPGAAPRERCQGEPFAAASRELPEAAPPEITFEVPSDIAQSERVSVYGIVCPDGAPSADGTQCEGESGGTELVLELELARDNDVNLNPELPDDNVSFDGRVWPPPATLEADCAGAGYLEVSSGSQHELGVALEASARDPLPVENEGDPEREAIQLSTFTTAGDLSRAFTSLGAEAQELSSVVTWTALDVSVAELVRFWIVVRDLRGGSDFAERAICVLP